MRTRTRYLPALLLILAAFLLAGLTATVASAIRPVVVAVDPGDPDEGSDYRSRHASPSPHGLIGPGIEPSRTCAPRDAMLEADSPAPFTQHGSFRWRLGEILLFFLLKSPVWR
jgi:hypothetical protein